MANVEVEMEMEMEIKNTQKPHQMIAAFLIRSRIFHQPLLNNIGRGFLYG
jgi:hypothetical protein